MGLLDFEGEPLSWAETKTHIDYIKEHGIQQFLHIYKKNKGRQGDVLKWGDEVEFSVFHFDHDRKKVRVLLRGEKICEKLMEKEKNDPENVRSLWRKEYGSYVIEGIPGKPYGGSPAYFNMVESNMANRRKEIEEHLTENEKVVSVTYFPRLGCESFTMPEYKLDGPESNPISRSIFYPDEAMSTGHPRFPLLTRNIRERRGKKIVINVPIFRDERTPSPFVEDFSDPEAKEASKPNHIYMDCMGLGMGCGNLQATLQACNLEEARILYDELVPVCPLMLALSAASPIFRGYLSDIDVRWNVIAASVDDRTDEERGIKPLKNNRHVIRKSRFDSIDCYLSQGNERYNDVNLEVDKKAKQALLDGGVDELLAQHIAHLWIRDPLTVFSRVIHLDDEKQSHHFENIQSTNWQSLRFKPPPPNSSVGWRIEFRPLDAQLTDFENTAYVVFIVLLTRTILTFKLNFLMPISLVDENMQAAHKNDAARKAKFWFRREIQKPDSAESRCFHCSNTDQKPTQKEQCFQRMSLDTIINGKEDLFPGLIPLIRLYLTNVQVDVATKASIDEYLYLISRRASGEYLTTAQWIRQFVRSHPEYSKDSVVSDSVTYDLLWRCYLIGRGDIEDHKLFRKPQNKSANSIP